MLLVANSVQHYSAKFSVQSGGFSAANVWTHQLALSMHDGLVLHTEEGSVSSSDKVLESLVSGTSDSVSSSSGFSSGFSSEGGTSVPGGRSITDTLKLANSTF